MKLSLLSLFCCVLFITIRLIHGDITAVFPEVTKYSNLSDAVNFIAQEISTLKVRQVSSIVLTCGSKESFGPQDFQNELLSKNFRTGEMLFHVYTLSNLTKLSSKRRVLAILIIETYADFIEIRKKISRGRLRKIMYAMVLIGGEFPELEEIFKYFWSIQVSSVITLFEDKNRTVLVKTFIPFKPGNCSDISPVLINQFKDGKLTNGSANIFPIKTRNLHKCPIRVAVSNDVEPYMFSKLLSNGTYQFSGLNFDLINTLAETVNFQVNYTFIGPDGFFYENGTSEGPLRAVLDGDADLSLSFWWLRESRLNFFDASNSYISDSLNFIIPPGSEYTTFEKLVFPFSYFLWITISVVNVVAFLVVFIVKLCSKTIQDFVFGTGVKHPYMNMYIGFMGGAQDLLPRRNFARFILMNYLLYALVIRTLYQGSYYRFLQSNRHHKRFESVKEMVENDFLFYVYEGAMDTFSGSELLRNRFDAI